MKRNLFIFLIAILMIFSSCSSSNKEENKNSGSGISLLSTPVLLEPLTGAEVSGDVVVLKWRGSDSEDIKYNLYVGSEENRLNEVVSEFPYTSYTLMVTAGNRYYWKVEAIYGDKVSSSEVRWFYVPLVNLPPSPPEIVYPAGITIHINYVHLRWDTGMDPDGDTVTCKVYLGSSPDRLSLLPGGLCDGLRTVGPLANGEYWWKIEECDSYDNCSTSTTESFQILLSDTEMDSLKFYPVAPTDGTILSAGDEIRFAWRPIQAYSDVVYSILLSINGSSWVRVATDLRSNSFYYRPSLPDGEYRWRVAAYLPEYGIEISSEVSRFYTSGSVLTPLSKRVLFFDLSGSDYGKEGICVINGLGKVVCWGYSESGAIGVENPFAVTPFTLDLPDDEFFTDISVSSGIGCAVSLSGKLYCWGSQSGARFDGFTGRYIPIEEKVDGVSRWVKVSAGYGPHVCALSSMGKLYCWGNNDMAEIGKDPSSILFSFSPLEVTPPSGGRWIDVAAGGKFTCAIEEQDSGRALYCWGSEEDGALGNGETGGYISTPVRPLYSEAITSWSSVYAGKNFACGLTEDGRLFCWGDNRRGEVGVGSGSSVVLYPREVSNPDGRSWKFTGMGLSYLCAMDDENSLYCWGERASDEGYGFGRFIGESFSHCITDYTDVVTRPVLITGYSPWRFIAGGAGVTCGLDVMGKLFCSGNRKNNGIFLDKYPVDHISDPAKIEMYPGQRWMDVGMSNNNVCATDSSGLLLCWGRNNGELWGNYSERVVPTVLFPQHKWVRISRYNYYDGDDHYFRCAIDDLGKLWCWGNFVVDGYYGDYPVEISNPEGNRWVDVDEGNLGVCAIDDAGKLYCWGKSQSDRSNLGLGAIDAEFVTPQTVPVSPDLSFKEVSLGYFFGCALATNGDIYCWGDSDWVQTGYGYDLPTPAKYTRVEGPFVHVSCEYDTMCAIKENGEIWCQGKNVTPQGTAYSMYPWQAGVGDVWVWLATARYSACSLGEANNIFCWNEDIGLSDVDTEGYDIEKIFINASGVGCFIDDQGSLYCWGNNSEDFVGVSSVWYPERIDW